MGLFGTIGKMAGSKIIEQVSDGLTKKQNCEQTGKYSKYIKTNIARISKTITELETEARALIEQIQAKKGVKLSFREKSEFRKIKDKANKNLEYLYLIRDFFTALAKNASGLILKNEEIMLVSKFAPYFDGVPVLDIEDEDADDSILGAFREVGQELKEAIISSKKIQVTLTLMSICIGIQTKLESTLCQILTVLLKASIVRCSNRKFRQLRIQKLL